MDGWACITFEGLWEGLPHVDPMGIGTAPCPGFHQLLKELLPIGIPDEGTDPCQEFQVLDVEEVPGFPPVQE
jgi:hypothetical protein